MVVKLSDFLSTNFVPSALDSGDVLTIVRANTIAIDSNTTGNYVDTIIGGAGITVTGAGAHAATPTITFDSSMVVGVNATQTLTNKTINLTNNTLSTTLGQLNAAVSGATLVSTDGAETLTNKILTSPTINTPNITAGSITDLTTFGLRDITTTAYETRIVSNNVTPALSADRTLTLDVNNANRTFSLSGNLTLGGNFTTSGAHATTFITSGATALTLPTSGTLVSKNDSGDVTIAGTLTGELNRSANTTVQPGVYGSASLVPVLTIDANGFVDSAGTVSVAGVSSLAFDSATHKFTINTADGGSYSEIVQTKMPGTSGTFGSASQVPVITVNKYGLVDSISNVNVAGVTSFTLDSTNGAEKLTIGTADGGSFTAPLKEFLRSDTTDSASGALTFGGATTFKGPSATFLNVNQFTNPNSSTIAIKYNTNSSTSEAGVILYEGSTRLGNLTYWNGASFNGSPRLFLENNVMDVELSLGKRASVDSDIFARIGGTEYRMYHEGNLNTTDFLSSLNDDSAAGNITIGGNLIVRGSGQHRFKDGTVNFEENTVALYTNQRNYNASGVVLFNQHLGDGAQSLATSLYASSIGGFVSLTNFGGPDALAGFDRTGIILGAGINGYDSDVYFTDSNSGKWKMWHQKNQGSGSGMDADKLDGQEGSYYRIDVYDASGTLLN